MKDKDKKQKQTEKPEAGKQTTAVANGTDKKTTKRTVIVKKVKQGAGAIARNGDFIGRLGTLLVMIVTSINTGTSMVTSFIEKVWWKGAVHAALLTFIHIPMIAVMIWFMCKAKMQSLYNKIRPQKPGETVNITDVENDTVVYEEIIEVQDNEQDKSTNDKLNAQKVTQRVAAVPRESPKSIQQKREAKAAKTMKNAEQINKAFDHAMS